MVHKQHKDALTKEIHEEISKSLEKIDGWGSIEVIIQDNNITQVTEKNIRKPHKK